MWKIDSLYFNNVCISWNKALRIIVKHSTYNTHIGVRTNIKPATYLINSAQLF